MSTLTTQQQLAAVMDLTDAMLQAAQQQNWEGLNEKETRRRELLAGAFAETSGLQEAKHIAQCITHILDVDKQIIHLSEIGRQALSDKLRGLGRGRRAKAAYQGL